MTRRASSPAARGRSARGTVALLAFALAGVAFGACPLRDYRISGLVVDPNGAPLAGVVVTTTWEERSAGTLSNERETGSDGRFDVRVSFDTHSGRTLTGRDRCEAALDEVRLEFRRSGFGVRELRVDPGSVDGPLTVQLVPDR